MAAILGLQRLSKFKLPLMVVNVFLVEIALPIAKWELTFVVMLKRRNIVRSSCCGICAAVCPRGLKLEMTPGRPNQFERNFTRK
jgi:ferredoxin